MDESRLSFGAVVKNYREDANKIEIKGGVHPAESTLGKGIMAVYGVVSGFREAFKDFDEGDTTHRVIAVAESLHGIAELTGISKKNLAGRKGRNQKDVQ